MNNEDSHGEILRALGRLEGKLDGVLEEAKRTNGRVTKSEDKIRKLEDKQLVASTQAGVWGFIGGGILLAGWELIKAKYFK